VESAISLRLKNQVCHLIHTRRSGRWENIHGPAPRQSYMYDYDLLCMRLNLALQSSASEQKATKKLDIGFNLFNFCLGRGSVGTVVSCRV
jgi:hypothetical protein